MKKRLPITVYMQKLKENLTQHKAQQSQIRIEELQTAEESLERRHLLGNIQFPNVTVKNKENGGDTYICPGFKSTSSASGRIAQNRMDSFRSSWSFVHVFFFCFLFISKFCCIFSQRLYHSIS